MVWTALRSFVSVCLFLLLAAAGCTTAGPSPDTSTPATQPTTTVIHWQKYSDDIFARAKKENKFVLLDLEAVWCHWCHVQDEVTYADPKVIELMNQRYIAVKVDQDSRPDLANRYEDYGWPATIIFNANGGEIVKRNGYIPPKPMVSLLQAIIDDPTPGPSVGPELKIEFTRETSLSADIRKELAAKLNETYDAAQGGWGSVHKFVDWDAVEYCLTRAKAGDKQAEHEARQTLDAGLGLIDPVWGGVYQYSVGGGWNEPHYEKLMQFQAEMMRIYALAYAQFNDPRYLQASRAIRSYIANFLTSPDGAFYVSQDADLIPGEHSSDYFAMNDAARRKLGVPRVDTHCYSRENGWALRGLLAYYDESQDQADLAAAKRAAEWVIANRSLPDGGFRHDATDAAGPYLADTLAMGRAFLALYEATADRIWLDRAESAATFIAAHFRNGPPDGKDSAGFITAVAAGPFKPMPELDENIAAARFFNLLYQYAGRKQDRESADIAMRFLVTPKVAQSRSLWFAGILLADAEMATEPLHVTIVGSKADGIAKSLFMEALKAPTGYRRVEWWDPSQGPLPRADVEYPQLPHAAAFICTGNACSSPMTEPANIAAKLGVR